MKKVTRDELETILIAELAKFKDCEGVTSIGTYKLLDPDGPDWEPAFINYGSADRGSCNSVLPKIVGKLLAEYELDINTQLDPDVLIREQQLADALNNKSYDD